MDGSSVHTVYAGTHSAGRLYEKIGDCAPARVMFITHSSVIAQVLSPEEATDGKEAALTCFSGDVVI